jgi:hypothetical protein
LLRERGAVAWREFFVIFDVAFLHLAANAAKKKRCCASRHGAKLLVSRVTGNLAYPDVTCPVSALIRRTWPNYEANLSTTTR